MARKRMIDPRIWESEDFSKLSYLSRIVWIGLFSNADDEGRGKANSAFIKSQIFPYEDISLKKIDESLKEIEKNMEILFYEVDEKKYFQLKNWTKFQTINRPTPSQFPAPETTAMPKNSEVKENNKKETLLDNSQITHEQFNECSMNAHTQLSNNSVPKKEKEIEIEREYKEESVKEESETSPLSTRPPKKKKYGKYKNVLLTEQEYEKLIEEPDGEEAIEFFSEYREMKGYKAKNDNLAIRKWAFLAVKEARQRQCRLDGKTKPKEDLYRHEYTKDELDAVFDSLDDVEI